MQTRKMFVTTQGKFSKSRIFMNIQKQPEIIDFERSNSSNCHEEISVNELASYLEFSTLIPRKMSSMAESIYG